MRWGRAGLLSLVAVLGVLIVGRLWAQSRAEQALSARGLSWSQRQDFLLGARWIGVSGPGFSADSLELRFEPAPRFIADQVVVDLSELALSERAETGPGGEAPGGSALSLLSADARAVSVYWGDQPLAEGLSGTLLPILDLQGPTATIRRDEAGLSATAQLPLDLPGLRGTADVSFSSENEYRFTVLIPDAVIDAPVLATRPLPPMRLAAELHATREGAIEGSLHAGLVQAALTGAVKLDPPHADLQIALPPTPLQDAVDLFGALVPEAARARMGGTISAKLSLSGPPLHWTLAPEIADLAVQGAVSDLTALKYGELVWRPPGEGASLQRTGEGTRTWTPLREMPRLAAAVIAAEDARFWTHHGLDITGVQEALDTWAAGDPRPRGGSTLTQQLAKNLFLDGERSIARKTRELLLALELDRALGKPRVLELYLNIVELGPGLYGARAASDAYFIKQPSGLSWPEAVFLAAILPSPVTTGSSAWSGGRPPTARMSPIYDNLVRLGSLSADEARAARTQTLRFVPPAQPPPGQALPGQQPPR